MATDVMAAPTAARQGLHAPPPTQRSPSVPKVRLDASVTGVWSRLAGVSDGRLCGRLLKTKAPADDS
jgi:hypothetical protein